MAKWSEEEIAMLAPYETSNKSSYVLYTEMRRAGFNRTYKAVTRKIDSLGLRKPSSYTTGQEKKLGYLDIETTSLKANVGIMLSWAIKKRDTNDISSALITKEEIFDGDYDNRIVEQLCEELNNYDTIFTYYGTRFDIPFIRTRAIDNNIRFPMYREVTHKDLYYHVRSKLRLSSNSLKTATEFMGIRGKTKLDPRVWRNAAYGDQKSLETVLHHNIADVAILERLHKKIEDYCPPTVVPI
tara:strand:+ start:2141 stop:2863 length:723 start_codon:yes stop_codon:yes gene_type:complete